MTTLTVSMPESLKTFIDEEVATKGYGNVSEYIRSLLRDAQKKAEQERIESLLLEGLASGGADIPVTPEFWTNLRQKARERVAQRNATSSLQERK